MSTFDMTIEDPLSPDREPQDQNGIVNTDVAQPGLWPPRKSSIHYKFEDETYTRRHTTTNLPKSISLAAVATGFPSRLPTPSGVRYVSHVSGGHVGGRQSPKARHNEDVPSIDRHGREISRLPRPSTRDSMLSSRSSSRQVNWRRRELGTAVAKQRRVSSVKIEQRSLMQPMLPLLPRSHTLADLSPGLRKADTNLPPPITRSRRQNQDGIILEDDGLARASVTKSVSRTTLSMLKSMDKEGANWGTSTSPPKVLTERNNMNDIHQAGTTRRTTKPYSVSSSQEHELRKHTYEPVMVSDHMEVENREQRESDSDDDSKPPVVKIQRTKSQHSVIEEPPAGKPSDQEQGAAAQPKLPDHHVEVNLVSVVESAPLAFRRLPP